MLYSAVPETGTLSRYNERLSEAVEQQYDGLTMYVTQTFGSWWCKKGSELKDCTMDCDIEWTDWYREESSQFAP